MMDRAQWERIQALFHRAAELGESDRERVLEQGCAGDAELLGKVRAMIEEDSREGSLLDRDIAQVAGRILDTPAIREIGGYRIERILGEGGMGVVYLAARKDLGNLVALKILREAWPSPARRQRFEAEQRTLAQLNHPSIARLYDAGTLADGTPWFAMEYVEGVPLTEFCRERGSGMEERIKLFRAVCEAVEYAHQHGIVHRDLKPSNVLVRRDGSVRLLDFGIAKQINPGSLQAHQTRTGLHLLTPAYASPEQIRGEAVGVASDVYSLGVMLYELLTVRLPFDLSDKTPAEAANLIAIDDPIRPSAVVRRGAAVGSQSASWPDLDVLCLTAMHRDRQRRYASVTALIGDLDRYLKHAPLLAHPDSPAYIAGKFLRRNWAAVSVAALVAALILFAGSLALTLRRGGVAPTRARTVTVLPFVNTGSDHSMDFLASAIPEEITRVLGHARSLTVRPFDASRAGADPQKTARAVGAASVVTGRFVKEADQLQVTIEVLDAETNHSLWRDTFMISAANTLRLQGEIAKKTRNEVGPSIGAKEFTLARLLNLGVVAETANQPRSQQAYDLFLRAMAMTGADEVKQARAMLEKSVALDPGYAPAWIALSGVCEHDGWYRHGGAEAAQCAIDAVRRAAALDPENVWTAASLIFYQTEHHQSAEAYRIAADLVRRRPEDAGAHWTLGYVLRYAGLLDEAERECDAAIQLDLQDVGLRSCGVAFLLHGDYARALDFLHLSLGSQWEKALSMDVLLRQGKPREALAARPGTVPDWAGFPLLFAYLDHHPANEIATLARGMSPVTDPEMNYFSAAHLAYAGQTDASLQMLRSAITAGYCAYPGIESDPMFAGIRPNAAFVELRTLARACRDQFMAARSR